MNLQIEEQLILPALGPARTAADAFVRARLPGLRCLSMDWASGTLAACTTSHIMLLDPRTLAVVHTVETQCRKAVALAVCDGGSRVAISNRSLSELYDVREGQLSASATDVPGAARLCFLGTDVLFAHIADQRLRRWAGPGQVTQPAFSEIRTPGRAGAVAVNARRGLIALCASERVRDGDGHDDLEIPFLELRDANSLALVSTHRHLPHPAGGPLCAFSPDGDALVVAAGLALTLREARRAWEISTRWAFQPIEAATTLNLAFGFSLRGGDCWVLRKSNTLAPSVRFELWERGSHHIKTTLDLPAGCSGFDPISDGRTVYVHDGETVLGFDLT